MRGAILPSLNPVPRRGRSWRRIAAWRVLTALVFAAALILDGAQPRAADPADGGAEAPQTPAVRAVEPAEEDLLILALRLNNLVLSEDIIAYQIQTGVCLYFSEVAEALDFAIEVDAKNGRAAGWFLSEGRDFRLDLERREVIVRGAARDFDADRIELHPRDICVELSLLSAWFPIEFQLDMRNLAVNLRALETLPIEERLKREKRRKRFRKEQGATADYLRVKPAYKPIDWPVVDLSFNPRWAKTDKDQDAEFLRDYSVLVAGDLAYMNGELFVSGNTETEAGTVRARLGRKDPRGELLGPLKATEFTLGDVATPQTPLVTRSVTGRGFEVSNFPLDAPQEFDRTTLRGNLQAGWEVELYRNGALLEFQLSRPDGRYEFIDVPLLFGSNEFQLLFYGPQGQRREETQRVFVGPNLVKAGEHYLRAVVNQHKENLVNVTSDKVQDDPEKGEVRVVSQYEFGLFEGFSAAASLYSIPLDETRRTYGGVGARGIVESFTAAVDGVFDDSGGRAVEIAAQGLLGPLNLFGRHDQFFEFFSERANDEFFSERENDQTNDFLTNRSLGRLDTVVPIGSTLHLPVSVQAEHELRDSGEHRLKVSNRLSTAYRDLLVTSNFDYNRVFGGNSTRTENADGAFLVNYRMAPFMFRGEINYRALPDADVTAASLTFDWDIDEDFTVRLGAQHRFATQLTEFNAGLNKRFEQIAVGADLGVADDGTFFAGLSLSLSLGREPVSGDVTVTSERLAQQGQVTARAFVDENNNGRLDDGDQPFPDVGFEVDRRKSGARTDADGSALIGNIPVHRDLGIQISRGTLEDPYLVPGIKGLSVVARPGVVQEIEFPIVRTGEIEGEVRLMADDSDNAVADVVVELVDETGAVVRTVESEFDGYYIFEFVPVGRYTVRVSPAQLSKLSLAASARHLLVLSKEEPVRSGVDFTLNATVMAE